MQLLMYAIDIYIYKHTVFSLKPEAQTALNNRYCIEKNYAKCSPLLNVPTQKKN